MDAGDDRLSWLAALREPARAMAWSLERWQTVVRLARRQRLLARLASALQQAGLLRHVPAAAQRHLVAELRLSAWRTTAMCWALHRIAVALDGCDTPLVLLKGAAYVGQALPIAAGRLPSDVDVLVPRDRIAEVQARLQAAGWNEVPLDEHDRRYYHEWSHEVPPLQHPAHHIELDLHHNILPPVAAMRVDADLLLTQLRPSRWPRWSVLDPADQVLHSASHLFQDAEARDRLRDLADLDALMRHFGADAGFWQRLPERAHELGLSEPLALAVHYCSRWLATPVPSAVARRIVGDGLPAARRLWLVPLLDRILAPDDPEADSTAAASVAAALFLARHHYNRMPLRLLLPHLWHKLRASEAREQAQLEVR